MGWAVGWLVGWITVDSAAFLVGRITGLVIQRICRYVEVILLLCVKRDAVDGAGPCTGDEVGVMDKGREMESAGLLTRLSKYWKYTMVDCGTRQCCLQKTITGTVGG